MDPQKSKSPAFISPLEVKVKSRTYTYSSSRGLQTEGHCFDPDVADYLPLLEPVLTKKGTIKVHQPSVKKQPAAYWKAQCAFRDLPQSGTIAALQERLRQASGVGMAGELVQAEKDLKEEFWRILETDEQKAEADPDRFLREKLIDPSQRENAESADVIVLKTHMRRQLHEAASPLGLCHQSVDAPLHSDGREPNVNRWIVIGCSQSVVDEEIQRVTSEAARMRQSAQDARAERIRELHEAVVSSAKKNSAEDGGWDIAGAWAISCPYVERHWGQSLGRGRDCSLDIKFTKSSGQGQQMWAKFNFIALKGVFRFETPSAAISSGKSRAASSSRHDDEGDSEECRHDNEDDSGKRTDDNEGNSDEYISEEDSEDDDEFRRSPTCAEFYLGTNERPSPSCPQWNFRWRGEETGEGVIQLDSDERLCSVTFGGVGGTELSGWIISDLTGKIKFTGLKTGPSGSSSSERTVEDEWSSRNEEAYEWARVARWK